MVDRICDNCMSRVPAVSDKCPQCGIRFENTNPGGALPNGWVLGGRYTVGRYLEIDGEGVTYSAIDGNTLQRVTIKEYMPVTLCATRDEEGNIVAKPGNEVLFKTTRMDFTDLYNSLLRMSLTEGLVQVMDVLEENNTAYAVLEKIEGPTLAEYLTKKGGAIDHSRALAVLRPVFMGVEALHSANLVHRGISPENIILESGGTAKLGGYAILALRQQGSELKPKLYPGYSAPEQYAANEFEGRYTDVYALGAVLYRMVTGEVPDPADERKMQDNLRPARAENKEVPAYLSTGIARAMRMPVDERIQNISDLRLALSGEGGSNKAKKAPSAPAKLSTQQLIVGGVALGAIVVLLLVVLFINLFGGSKPSSTSSSTSVPDTTSIAGVQDPLPTFVGNTRRYVENMYASQYTFDFYEGYSSQYPEGYVYEQDPAPGSDYTGGTIRLGVSLGEDPAANNANMPDLVTNRVTQEQAEKTLKDLEIQYTIVQVENDGNYNEGQVVRTDPQAGTAVNILNDKVLVYVAGAKPITMPDLFGDSWDTATSKLQQAGLSWAGEPQYVDNPQGQYAVGTVVRASVDFGANINPSNKPTITIYLARGAQMPNYFDRDLAAVEQELQQLAESVSNTHVNIQIQYRASDKAEGKVVDSNIAAGGQVFTGDTIILYVSTGPGEG